MDFPWILPDFFRVVLGFPWIFPEFPWFSTDFQWFSIDFPWLSYISFSWDLIEKTGSVRFHQTDDLLFANTPQLTLTHLTLR